MPPGPAPFFRTPRPLPPPSSKLDFAPGTQEAIKRALARIPRITLWCPLCSAMHVDAGEWSSRPHRTHLCLDCGHTWTPSYFYTFGRHAVTRMEQAKAVAMVAKRLLKRLVLAALERR